MRHGIAGNRLNRNSTLRKATIRDLAKATLIAERICTTKAKAKEARKMVEHLITLGKRGTLADKRLAFAILCDHGLVSSLFNETSPRFKNRNGGYTRIIKLGQRRGDNAELAFLELTEKKEIVVSEPKTKSKKEITEAKIIKEEKPKAEKKAEVKDKEAPAPKAPKKEPVRQERSEQKDLPVQDKGKPGMMGGIRKMFNRKTGGGA